MSKTLSLLLCFPLHLSPPIQGGEIEVLAVSLGSSQTADTIFTLGDVDFYGKIGGNSLCLFMNF